MTPSRRSSPPRRSRRTPDGSRPRALTSSPPTTCRTCARWSSSPGSGAAAAGVFINHEASRTSNDCYVCEIPAGGELAPQRQLYEEMILVLDGHGSTRVWNDAGAEVTFEWGPGSLFAIPINANHQHFNGSGPQRRPLRGLHEHAPGDQPLRRRGLRLRHHARLPRPLQRRARLLLAKGEQKGLLLDTNFVADAVSLPLVEAKERGAGGGHIRFAMAKGSMNSHISQFPTATYKKGHRHGPGAHVIILSGTGYSLMWPEGEEPKRYDWGPGTLIVPPNMWFHQHFNTGTEPAATSPSSTRRSRSATPRACPRRGSASGSAATRSTTPTSPRSCARPSQGAGRERPGARDGRGVRGRARDAAAQAVAAVQHQGQATEDKDKDTGTGTALETTARSRCTRRTCRIMTTCTTTNRSVPSRTTRSGSRTTSRCTASGWTSGRQAPRWCSPGCTCGGSARS